MDRADVMRRGALMLGAIAAVGLLLGLSVWLSGRPPDGPVAVDWDRIPCARCGMLVSDPAFAAQLHLVDGSVQHFDDPGCLLLTQAETEAARIHAVWFHHHAQERWLPEARTAFVRVAHSPMGYGLGAVERGEVAGAIDPEAARAGLLQEAGGASALAGRPGPEDSR